MSQRMHMCPRCENKVRTLYEWKDEEFCGMCQQENIERYEATLVYRFFLLLKLTKDYMEHVSDRVFFPDQGWARRATKFVVYYIEGGILYVKRLQGRARERVKRLQGRARERRAARKVRRADRRQHRAEGKALRKLIKKRRKEELRERAKILKAAR